MTTITPELRELVEKKFTDQFWASTQGRNDQRNEILCSFVAEREALAERKGRDSVLKNISMLRQWLNEDRITDHEKMVDNTDLLALLTQTSSTDL